MIALDHGGQEHARQKSGIKDDFPIGFDRILLSGKRRQPLQNRSHLLNGGLEQLFQLVFIGTLFQKVSDGLLIKDTVFGLTVQKSAVLSGIDAVKQAVM